MERDKIIINTSIKGIVVNIILVIFKAIIGLFANSIAIILDAVNNLSDALSSIITIIGTKLARKAPDKKHPYGHGRIEYFASVIIAVIVLVAGLTSFKESVLKIISPEETNYTVISLIIISVTVITKFVFGKYVKNVGDKVNSSSLKASGTDAFFDAILSFSTLVAGIISIIWNLNIEGFLGIIIAIIIIKSSIEILKETIDNMIGTRIDQNLAKNIKDTINQFDNVNGTYDLILHNYGPNDVMGSAHIEVPDEITAKDIHVLTRTIETKIYKEFGIILTLGVYASNTRSKDSLEIKKSIESIIKDYDSILQMHGFYIDDLNKTVMFDLIIDFEEKETERIKNEIINKLKEKYPKYNYSIIIDNDFSD